MRLFVDANAVKAVTVGHTRTASYLVRLQNKAESQNGRKPTACQVYTSVASWQVVSLLNVAIKLWKHLLLMVAESDSNQNDMFRFVK